MDKFEKEELKKEINYCLINYIPNAIRKVASIFKDKFLDLYNSKTIKVICVSGKKVK